MATRTEILSAFASIELPTNKVFSMRHEIPHPNEVLRQRWLFMKDPHALTYASLLSSRILGAEFPYLFEGEYIPLNREQETSHEVKKLLKFFGAGSSEELMRRTKACCVGLFEKHGYPEGGRAVMDTLSLVKNLRGEETRKSGEKAWAHEARVIMRSLGELFTLSQTPFSSFRERPHNPFSRIHIEQTAAALCGIGLHDTKEDFLQIPLSFCKQEGNILHFFHVSDGFRGSAKNRVLTLDDLPEQTIFQGDIIFPDTESATIAKTIMDTLTKIEYDPSIILDQESTRLNIDQILHQYSRQTMRRDTKHMVAWAVSHGKLADRVDNVSILWTYDYEKYIAKLIETFEEFQLTSLIAWSHTRTNAPMGISEALLKLLGGTDNELYGWIIEDEEVQSKMKTLEDQGRDPLIIPGFHNAMIITNDGLNEIVYRYPDSTERTMITKIYDARRFETFAVFLQLYKMSQRS